MQCVYVVWAKDTALYVGSSVDVYQRFQQHHKLAAFIENGATSIEYEEVEELRYLVPLENTKVKELLPILNNYASRPDTKSRSEVKERIKVDHPTRFRDRALSLMARRSRLITRTKMAQDLGISVSWLSQFENGGIPNPGVNFVEAIIEYLSDKENN